MLCPLKTAAGMPGRQSIVTRQAPALYLDDRLPDRDAHNAATECERLRARRHELSGFPALVSTAQVCLFFEVYSTEKPVTSL